MKKVCSYCREIYGETPDKPPPGVPPDAVSHGICPKCLPRANAELDEALRRQKERRDPCEDCRYVGNCYDDCPNYD